jgi:hypothetical protein
MNEHEIAIMEANRNGAEDEYFAARPQHDTDALRLIYSSGFERAWNAAMSGRNCNGTLIQKE